MGKSKKRTLNKKNDNNAIMLKRTQAVKQIIFDIKNNNINDMTIKYIILFGITSEELTEAGASYEEISTIKQFLF